MIASKGFSFTNVVVCFFLLLEDYMHHANPKTPIEETMRALVELKK